MTAVEDLCGLFKRYISQLRRTGRPVTAAVLVSLLMACEKPSPEAKRQEALRRQEVCRDDPFCGVDPKPAINDKTVARLKWNDEWFVVPAEYRYNSGLGFYWPTRRPSSVNKQSGAPEDWFIYVLPRSYDIPPEPRGYLRIEVAEREGRVLERVALRAGLDRIRYFYKHPVTGEIDKKRPVTVYVATQRREPSGRFPIFACEKGSGDPKQAGGSAGFMWRDGIYLEVLVREGDVCEDWPEIYDEILNVLKLVKKV